MFIYRTTIFALEGYTVVTNIEMMETNVPKPGKVISRSSPSRIVRHFAVLPGSHIVQDKSITSASNCIFSVFLRLTTAGDGRREQEGEEAAYGEPDIAYFATSESGTAPWVESGTVPP
jgi:hypothetical protein